MGGDKKRLAFSRYDFSDSDEEIREITPPPLSIPVKSPEKLRSNHAAPDSSRSRKKRKATTTMAYYSGPSPKIFWTQSDELRILQGIVDYRKETGVDYNSDTVAFYDYLKDAIESDFTKVQLMGKITKLKTKFRDNSAKKNPCFAKSHDSEIFDLSMVIWGKEFVNGNMNNANETKSKGFVEQEAGTNGEPEDDDDGSAKEGSCDVKFPRKNLDKNMENEADEKESEEDETVAGEKESEEDEAVAGEKGSEEDEAIVANGKREIIDDGSAKSDSLPSDNVDKHVDNETGVEENKEDELCALEDALEATMFQQSSSYAEKMMIQKLRTLEAKERKELSDEWKALLVQEMQLKSKKQCFAGKLITAALE